MAAPPQAAPAQAPSDPAGGATTESMDVDEANEEVLEVEVEAVWEDDEEEELDPRTLGVPGLRTLVPGDHVEVLWANGAFSPPCPAPQHAPDLRHLSCSTCAQDGRGGGSRSACSRCGHAGPSSSTASRTMTARRLPPPSLHTAWAQSALTTHVHRLAARNRWQRTCARSRHGEFARWRRRRTCTASISTGAC